MAPVWTAARDQNLLMLVIETLKPNYDDLAKKWREKYPNEDYNPTPKALTEHIASLKRLAKGSGGSSGTASTPKSSTKTAVSRTPASKRATAPKTPSSSTKRKRGSMSDEDDSEDEKMDYTPISKRKTSSRRSVSRKTYKEEASDEEDATEQDGTTGNHSPSNIDTELSKTTLGDKKRTLFASKAAPDHVGSIARSRAEPNFESLETFNAGDESDFDPMV